MRRLRYLLASLSDGTSGFFRWVSFFPRRAFGYASSLMPNVGFTWFIVEWFQSRRHRELLLGLPAALIAILLTIGGVLFARSSQPVLAHQYISAAITAHQEGNEALVDLYIRKAQLAEKESTKSTFQDALKLQSIGRHANAFAIVHRLAPEDQPGYLPAHQWMTGFYVRELARLQTPKTDSEVDEQTILQQRSMLLALIEKHLGLILQKEPDHLAANEESARMRLAQGDFSSAAEYLARVVDRNQALRLALARSYVQLNETEKANQQAEAAILYHRAGLKSSPVDSDQWQLHRINLSGALIILGEYEEAARNLLDEGQLPKHPAIQKALVDALFIWSESIVPNDGATLVQKMKLLDQALKLAPKDPRILQRLAMLAGQAGEIGDQARTALKAVLTTGEAPASVHFILGMHAFENGDTESAIRHWDLAHRTNPNMPVTLNNLAVLLARQESPDLDRALEMVNRAIELSPEVADFYDSRGEIQLIREQYTEAIADMEKALQMSRQQTASRPATHDRLAQAYEQVGDSELAALHRGQAKFFRENPNGKPAADESDP